MKICFYANNVDEKEITRNKANGYKRIVVDKKVKSPCMVSVVSEDIDTMEPKLVIKPENIKDKTPDKYMFLCKNIGFVGYAANFQNKVSIIFCDNDYMLVTLHEGMLILQENETTLKVFAIGVENVPKIEKECILWRNAKDLMSFIRYMGLKAEYPFDFEFMFAIEGDRNAAMENFSLKHIDEEDIDISMGAFAVLIVSIQR